ncbi:MAG: CBS domain-containing protein [Alphaproteobacteria bacterium]|nr:CBS domain-containing protein [Alphaproteobacteria bacterium]
MLISHILRDKGGVVHVIDVEATLAAAAAELTQRRVGAVVVVDRGGGLAGVLSERDIVRVVAKRGGEALQDSVASAMTRDVITASPHETVDECLGLMTDRRIRHLPVLENRRLVGIVSIGDLVARKIEAAQAEAAAMRAYITAG